MLREDVLGRLGELAQAWVTALSEAHGYGADSALARIYTFGSFRLGVHGPGAPAGILGFCCGGWFPQLTMLCALIEPLTSTGVLHLVPMRHYWRL